MCPIYRSRKDSKIQPGLLLLHVLAETCPTDTKMLDLIEMWLQALVEETGRGPSKDS
jgi:hypothetical protein